MKKRILNVLLCMTLLLTMGVSAFACDAPDCTWTEPSFNCCQYGNNGWSIDWSKWNWDKAGEDYTSRTVGVHVLDNSNFEFWTGCGWESGNYALGENITLEKTVHVTGIVNLNLNGFSIKSEDPDVTIIVDKDAILNVFDLSCNQNGKINMGPASLINNGTINLFSGVICGKNGIVNNGAANIFGGKVIGEDYGVYNNGKLVISGMPIISGKIADIYLGKNGTVEVGPLGIWGGCSYSIATEEKPADDGYIVIGEPACYDYSCFFRCAEEGYKVVCKLIDGHYVLVLVCDKADDPIDDPDDPERKLPFKDVFKTDYFYNDVCFMYFNNLMIGTSADTFEPYAPLTRGMVCTILYRMAGSPEVEITERFDDVEEGMWYDAPIAWAAKDAVVLGYGDGNYGPNDPVTREQLCSILWRYAKAKGIDVSCDNVLDKYADSDKITDYRPEFAVAQVNWAAANGLIFEDQNNNLNPTIAQTSRAEAAMLFSRFFQMIMITTIA